MPPSLRKRKAQQEPASTPTQKLRTTEADKDDQNPPRGRRLLLSVLHHFAKHSPDTVFACIARTTQIADGFEDITYGRFTNAVNMAANWLEERPGIELQSPGARIAYLGPSDLRYVILILAAQRVGAVMFLPSPHNSAAVQRDLVRAVGCGIVLHAEESSVQAADVVEGADVSLAVVPELEDLLNGQASEAARYADQIYDATKTDPFVILHTSGTTGVPKAVALPHSHYALEDLNQSSELIGAITSMPFRAGSRCLTTAPMWHAGGIFFGLLKPILNQVVTVLPPAGVPITADLVKACLEVGNIDNLQAAPSLLEDMVVDGGCISVLKELRHIIMGSGPMSKEAGDKLLHITPDVLHFFGATETDLLPLLPLNDPVVDWQYHCFHPLSGASFRPISDEPEDKLCELVLQKVEDAAQPCLEAIRDSHEFATKDVFSPHPTKKGLWKFECRRDDIITFSTGEKMSPCAAEAQLTSVNVKALLVGQGRRQSALLLHITSSKMYASTVIGDMWPAIEAANALLPKYGRIAKNLILLASDKEDSFKCTPKGTIMRRKTEEHFKARLDALYATADALTSSRNSLTSADNLAEVEDFVKEVHHHVTGVDLPAAEDVIANGTLDSLKVMQMTRVINEGLQHSSDVDVQAGFVTPALLYTHRTATGMAESLYKQITTKRQMRARRSRTASQEHQRSHSQPEHAHLLDKHVRKIAGSKRKSAEVDTALKSFDSVLLTGSTGSLGTHILHALIQRPDVKRVDCINRFAASEEHYLGSFPTDKPALSKVHFHHSTNLNAPSLGLTTGVFPTLASSTTTIIHNAWPVHFHLPLHDDREDDHAEDDCMHTLDSNVGGLASLISFASSSARHPQLVFISSMSAVIRCTSSIPGEIVDDPDAAESNGYAQSKWAGEQILAAAVKSGALRKARIIRPGQIAGPIRSRDTGSRGEEAGSVWDLKQAVPSMIYTSNLLGALPDHLGEKDRTRWIPVDQYADIVLELADDSTGQRRAQPSLSVYNTTNRPEDPGEVEKTWSSDVLPIVKACFERHGRRVEVMSLQQWIERVEEYGPKEENLAYKLLDFYEGLVGSEGDQGLGGDIEMEKSRAKSQTLKDLRTVSKEWMKGWLSGWGM